MEPAHEHLQPSGAGLQSAAAAEMSAFGVFVTNDRHHSDKRFVQSWTFAA